MTANQGLTLQFVGLIILAAIWLYFKAINEVRRHQGQGQPLSTPAPSHSQRPQSPPPPPQQVPVIKGEVLQGAGRAMARPPADLRVAIRYLQREFPDLQYAAPLGWYLHPTSEADCVGVGFVDDTYHMLITGLTRAGKDNLALNMMFSLARNYRPAQIQFCIIDGKGLDFAGLEEKAHTWRLALKKQEIKPAMEALSQERERRADLLRAAGLTKWEEYEEGDLPLLLVYIAELSLLQDATSKSELASWMNSELAAGAAFGIRYVVATQTATNFDTRWRSQISLYVAGAQSRDDQDEPNTGLTGKMIRAAGAVPPSELPPPPEGAGVFTVVHGRKCQTIRTTYLDRDQRQAWLSFLPIAPPKEIVAVAKAAEPVQLTDAQQLETLLVAELPAVEQPENTAVPTVEEAKPEPAVTVTEPIMAIVEGPSIEVPEEDRKRILEAATRLSSRRKICQELYGSPGGDKYIYISTVLKPFEKDALPLDPQKLTSATQTTLAA